MEERNNEYTKKLVVGGTTTLTGGGGETGGTGPSTRGSEVNPLMTYNPDNKTDCACIS